jgi:hypothetical protein
LTKITTLQKIVVILHHKQTNKNKKTMKATIKDIKEADRIVTESMKAKRGKGTYSQRMEDIMLTYENVVMNGNDCVIRLQNGTYQSIWNYIN